MLGSAVVLATPTREEFIQEIDLVTTRVTAILESASELAPRVRGEDWSVGDAASHLAVTQEVFANLLAGGPNPYAGHDPSTYGAVNAGLLEAAGHRDTPGLVTAIRRGSDAVIAAAAADPAGEFESPLGPMPLIPLLAYCLAHLLQHGHSIAVALGRPSPLEAPHVRLALPFVAQATPFAYRMRSRPGIDARVEMRITGENRFEIHFTPDAATVVPPSGQRIDCHLVCGPEAFLLILLGQADPLQMLLRRRAFAWGRRPWLGLQLKEYLPGL